MITVAAAEVAVGIGLILLCYRRWHAADVDRYDSFGMSRVPAGDIDRLATNHIVNQAAAPEPMPSSPMTSTSATSSTCAPPIVLTVWGLVVLLCRPGPGAARPAPPARRQTIGWLALAAAAGPGGGRAVLSWFTSMLRQPRRLRPGCSFAGVDYRQRPDRCSSWARSRPISRPRIQHAVHRAAGAGGLAVDGVVVHRGMGRVLRL